MKRLKAAIHYAPALDAGGSTVVVCAPAPVMADFLEGEEVVIVRAVDLDAQLAGLHVLVGKWEHERVEWLARAEGCSEGMENAHLSRAYTCGAHAEELARWLEKR